jgi:hypothetical protein
MHARVSTARANVMALTVSSTNIGLRESDAVEESQ